MKGCEIMSTYRFTEKEIETLQNNPNVKNVSEKAITYTKEFKEHFMTEYNKGKLPKTIFQEAGFDVKILGKRIKNSTHRWKEQNKRLEGLKDTRKGSSGRPRTKQLTKYVLDEVTAEIMPLLNPFLVI